MALTLTPQELPRTGASSRLLAEVKDRADRYARASQQPGLSEGTRSWLHGAAAGLQSAHDEMEWRLRRVEDEAALVPFPEPARILGSVIEDTAPSFDTLRAAGRNTSR